MLRIFVRLRWPLLPLIACLPLLQASKCLAADTWREVQSPHFRVITDGSDHDGRDVVVRGTIVTSACDKGVSVVLQPDGMTLPPTKLVAAGPFESGFSDTLWFGKDHYTPCFHIAGLPALVAYKADGSAPGNLLVLEVRDDLPDSHPADITRSVAKTADTAKP